MSTPEEIVNLALRCQRAEVPIVMSPDVVLALMAIATSTETWVNGPCETAEQARAQISKVRSDLEWLKAVMGP